MNRREFRSLEMHDRWRQQMENRQSGKELERKHATLKPGWIWKTDRCLCSGIFVDPTHLSFCRDPGCEATSRFLPSKSINDESDATRYQTIYASGRGSAAAPTGRFAFIQEIFDKLNEKGIQQAFLTCMGAGTFKPVKATTMAGHDMHAEWTM